MAFTEIDEKLLVQAYQAGDERAFDQIVRTQYNALYAHALRRLSQHEAAEDAVQDTLLRAYRALPNLDGDLALRAWLHRILTNVCHDEGNRRRRQQGLVEKVAALPEELGDDPVEEAVLHDTVRVMSEALQDLPEAYREALVLRYVDGLSFREVAEATGVTEENARARVHRGRAALHKIMSRVAVLAAFLIPGLRRTHAAASGTADQAVGASDHAATAVNLTTQLTSHVMTAAPTVSRFAEMSSGIPSGAKSALAAAAVTAVAAVSVPVAVHTVNEVRKPEPRPAAVAGPATTTPALKGPSTTIASSGTTSTSSSSTTASTLPPSQENPFAGDVDVDSDVELAPVQAATPPSTTTTMAPASSGTRLEGHVAADDLTVVGTSPQYDVTGSLRLQGDDKSWTGDLSGRIFVRPDDHTAASDDLSLDLGDVVLSLRFQGTVIATSESSGGTEATYHISGRYKLTGAEDVGLAGLGDVTASFQLKTQGASSLELDLVGQDSH
jgi:RNA polymerase sigma-70 factor (ECF subfamily)